MQYPFVCTIFESFRGKTICYDLKVQMAYTLVFTTVQSSGCRHMWYESVVKTQYQVVFTMVQSSRGKNICYDYGDPDAVCDCIYNGLELQRPVYMVV